MDESAALNPKQLLPSPVTVTVFQFLSAAEPKNDSQSIQKWVAITTIEGTNVEFCQNQENGCQMQMDCLFSVGELSFSLASSSSVKLFTKQMMTDCRHTENSDLTDEISSQSKFWPEGSIVLEKLLNKSETFLSKVFVPLLGGPDNPLPVNKLLFSLVLELLDKFSNFNPEIKPARDPQQDLLL